MDICSETGFYFKVPPTSFLLLKEKEKYKTFPLHLYHFCNCTIPYKIHETVMIIFKTRVVCCTKYFS